MRAATVLIAVAILLMSTPGGMGQQEAEQNPRTESAMKVRDWWPDHLAKLESEEASNRLEQAVLDHIILAARRRAGDFAMFNPDLPPAEKYPYAYKHYQAAMSVRDWDDDCQQKIAMIEGIYQSLGRPIPRL